jgi:hypothetical protein
VAGHTRKFWNLDSSKPGGQVTSDQERPRRLQYKLLIGVFSYRLPVFFKYFFPIDLEVYIAILVSSPQNVIIKRNVTL